MPALLKWRSQCRNQSLVPSVIPYQKVRSMLIEYDLCLGSEQSWDYNAKTHVVTWTFKDFKGCDQGMLTIRATLEKVYFLIKHSFDLIFCA